MNYAKWIAGAGVATVVIAAGWSTASAMSPTDAESAPVSSSELAGDSGKPMELLTGGDGGKPMELLTGGDSGKPMELSAGDGGH